MHAGKVYNRETPILFIGGMPRSGTTLMRSMMGKTLYEVFIEISFFRCSSENEMWRRNEAGSQVAWNAIELVRILALRQSLNFSGTNRKKKQIDWKKPA